MTDTTPDTPDSVPENDEKGGEIPAAPVRFASPIPNGKRSKSPPPSAA